MSNWIKIEDKRINIDNIDYFEWEEIHRDDLEEYTLLKIWFGNSQYVPITVKKTLIEWIEATITQKL